jgi:predicted acyl esterase
MTGVSYLAITQWTGAATRPPHLAAINPWEGFTDPYPDFSYSGGVRENGFMVVWSAWQKFMRPRSGSFRGQQKRHPLRDSWWAARSPDLEKIDVPALVCGSFSDHSLHSRGSFEGFRRIGSVHKWLYTHRAPKWSTYYGKPALDAQTTFFDHFLRGDDTGILEQAPVRVEVRESLSRIAAVRTADRWPPAQARPLTLHLNAADRLLSATPPSTAANGRRAAGGRAVPLATRPGDRRRRSDAPAPAGQRRTARPHPLRRHTRDPPGPGSGLRGVLWVHGGHRHPRLVARLPPRRRRHPLDRVGGLAPAHLG